MLSKEIGLTFYCVTSKHGIHVMKQLLDVMLFHITCTHRSFEHCQLTSGNNTLVVIIVTHRCHLQSWSKNALYAGFPILHQWPNTALLLTLNLF